MFRFFSLIIFILPLFLVDGRLNTAARTSIQIPEIPIKVYQYRLLNEQGEQVLLSFVWSWPRSAYLEDQDWSRPFEIGSNQGQYRLTHGIHLMNSDGTVVEKSNYHPRLMIHQVDNIPSASTFTVPYLSEGLSQLFYVELENLSPRYIDSAGNPTLAALQGTGRVELNQPEPLPVDGLLLGDLIMGYHRDPGSTQEGRFPFTISNPGTIPNGENVVVHFELYNLQPNDNGITGFEIDYDIRSINRILFWERVRSHDDLSITLNFRHDSTRFIETLEVETQGLDPGNYELALTARDLSTGEESQQTIPFSIVPG